MWLDGIFQHKRDLQNHFVANDLAFFDLNLLLLDPCTLDPAKCFGCSGNTLSNGILEALVRG